jgi:hypothetical protein
VRLLVVISGLERWLASAGVEETGVQDVSNVLRDLCDTTPALR